MNNCKNSNTKDEAILSSADGFTAFSFGGYNIRFRAPYSLERYVDVVKWDDGYLVVLAKYSHNAEPEEEVNGGVVRIVFRRATNGDDSVNDRRNDSVNDRRNDSVNDSLNDSVNETYLTIKANPGIQRKRISELTGKSIPTVDRHIALLAKASLIEHRDSDKTGGYYPVAKG